MKATRMLTALCLALGLGVAGISLTACEEQGPMEEAGEEVDDTADDFGDELDDLAE